MEKTLLEKSRAINKILKRSASLRLIISKWQKCYHGIWNAVSLLWADVGK
jgi:hypothetical protein